MSKAYFHIKSHSEVLKAKSSKHILRDIFQYIIVTDRKTKH